MTPFPLYGFCMIVSASLVVLLAMSTDFFAAFVNDIISPCQHDSVWRDGACVCDNSRIYGGPYCDECQCKHLGICTLMETSYGRYACRCPSHQKWVGTLCDKCYTTIHNDSLGVCRGPCKEYPSYKHYGKKCDTVCMPDDSSLVPHCVEVTLGGGTCNACNGHGSCSDTGQCQCDEGYFTSKDGEQCSVTCPDCPQNRGRCVAIGGQVQCICEEGFYGADCDKTCPSNVTNVPCSGHGSCAYDAINNLVCTCDTHWTGKDCSLRCPGDDSYATPCSGHGTCINQETEAVCECAGTWDGLDCACSPKYTCSGHGTCRENSTCACFDSTEPEIHFTGSACERCQEHWFGDQCHLRCDAAMSYTPNANTDGLNIGCNGHGACTVVKEQSIEHITCTCDNTDPATFCASCMADYYPKWSIENISSNVQHCSVECNPGTCSYQGACNEQYDGYNHLCECSTVTVGDMVFDTVDPEQFCSTCKPNWYPSQMDSSNRCTKYCAADGQLVKQPNMDSKYIVFGNDLKTDLEGDVDAQKVCVPFTVDNETYYGPDPDCAVCSGQGTCQSDGQCRCNDKMTGAFCEINCGSTDGIVCSGHGRCQRNDLDLWFNPYSEKYRCECMPYDPYTSQTRQRLIKQGFQLEPPPSADFYGEYCDFHCPTFNEEICSDRGSCSTKVAVDNSGYQRACTNDANCSDIPGAFCARLSTPWDSLMKDANGQVSGASFFEDGPQSPGYYTCAVSNECIDSIYSIKWDEFCVNMLNGWYPSILNTATCAYAGCQDTIEDFFAGTYQDGKTWCENAMEVLAAPMRDDDVCGKQSYADEAEFIEQRVPICHEYTLATTCNAQRDCIYDQTLGYIEQTDANCAAQTTCSGACQSSGNNTCETKTYCRAKTCADALTETSVESLCNIEPPCDAHDEQYWLDFCASASGQLRNISSMTSLDTFYSCVMYHNRQTPQRMETTIPGDISINGILQIYGEDVPISNLRSSVIESRVKANDACLDVSVNQSFCTQHLLYRTPSWYQPQTPTSDWFLPWLVVCPEGPDSVWATESAAAKRILQLSPECLAYYRVDSVQGQEFETSSDEKDTISYNAFEWSLECLGDVAVDMHYNDYAKWPDNPSRCQLVAHPKIQRWGHVGWTPDDVQQEFTEACLAGLEAPWVPKADDLPTLCSMGACHPNDMCIPCYEEGAECDATASVQCVSDIGIDCREENRCQYGGNCFQPANMLFQNSYLCDFVPNQTVTVTTGSQPFNASLSTRGLLTIHGAADIVKQHTQLTIDGTPHQVGSFFSTHNDVSFYWGTPTLDPEQPAETLIASLQKCSDNFNWYAECQDKPMGVELTTMAGQGLGEGWSGNARLLGPSKLLLTKVTYAGSGTSLSVHTDDRVRIACKGNQTAEDVGQISVTGTLEECSVQAVYGSATVHSVTVDGVEQMLTFAESAQTVGQRHMYVDQDNASITDYASWTFYENGVMMLQRNIGDILPNTGVCQLSEQNQIDACEADPPRGAKWDINLSEDDIRISGWSKISDTEGHVADMQMLNGENEPVLSIFVASKRLHVNGERTSCRIVPHEWFSWRMEAIHHDEYMFNTDDNSTAFEQQWHLFVSVDGCEWSGVQNITTGVSLETHAAKSAHSFHSIADQSQEECHAHCLGHDECQQWSWTHEDRHCYLHRARCHEDASCMHGGHFLHAFHSHKIRYLEVFSEASGSAQTFWAAMRAEPLLHFAACEPINTSSIDERWRQAFEDQYVPYNPDITSVCNHIAKDWRLLPEYTNKVCQGRTCTYDAHDMGACAQHLDTVQPDVPSESSCDAPAFLSLNWTAFCHYSLSFEPVNTQGSEARTPFLGGQDILLETMCPTPLNILNDMYTQCPSASVNWFKGCFKRTETYEDYCSSECIDYVETMLMDSPGNEGICSKRTDFLSVADQFGCDCSMDHLLITDFCIMQTAYHDGNKVLIPELYNSECSTSCRNTLYESMNRTQWRTWCKDFSDGDVPGTCSKTKCDCETEEYAGVAGEQCELICPSGTSQDGEELACSGRNGRCFAKDPSEMITDIQNQAKAGQVRGLERDLMTFLQDNPDHRLNTYADAIPEWVQSSTSSIEGQCQCALGSGLACSIPCEGCNNGTYGYVMASQYGICDSFNGICRALPPFMRYNTKRSDPDMGYISYNTTAFEASQGVYKWTDADVFLYESDQTLLKQVVRYLNDRSGVNSGRAAPNDIESLLQVESIDTMLRVFRPLCWPPVNDTFVYLSNEKDVTFTGARYDQGIYTLKETSLQSWGKCKKVQISDDWYLCFVDGRMHAYDTSQSMQQGGQPGPLLVMSSGDEDIPPTGMNFVRRTDTLVYGFGGVIRYTNTEELFNHLYEIKVTRRRWSPHDVVFLEWSRATAVSSVTPPKMTFAPMATLYDTLFLSSDAVLYKYRYKTPTRQAEWFAYDMPIQNASILGLVANGTNIQVYFSDANPYTFDTTNATWSEGAPAAVVEPATALDSGQIVPSHLAKMPCTLEVTNTSVLVGNNVIFTTSGPATYVNIYLEEWLTIDLQTNIDVVERVNNAIDWRIVTEPTLEQVLLSSIADPEDVLDMVSRVHMHQARWSVSKDMKIRATLATTMGTDDVIYLSVSSSEPSSTFMSLFSTTLPSYFVATPNSKPNVYTVTWEGDVLSRSMLIYGLKEPGTYAQDIDFETDVLTVTTTWSDSNFQLVLTRQSVPGSIVWSSDKELYTFALVIHLEAWIYHSGPVSQFTVDGVTGWQALCQMFVSTNKMLTHNMLMQLNRKLEYTPSHCSVTGNKNCPGILPYVGLPCSGRGSCSLACQCNCDPALSVIQESDTSLQESVWTDSPWRGNGCELACPGYDGYTKESICSNKGVCQRDGTCACEQKFTGDACQFKCPENANGEICSTHGGCGTTLVDAASFVYTNNDYLDTLTARNQYNYEDALYSFYGRCTSGNFVHEKATFGSLVEKRYPLQSSTSAAALACQEINNVLELDLTKETYRLFPSGRCVGFIREDTQFVNIVLKELTETTTYDVETLKMFECSDSECQIDVSEKDDDTLSGITESVLSPVFNFKMRYVHGNSNGRKTFTVNEQTFYIDMEWDVSSCKITFASNAQSVVVVNENLFIQAVNFEIEGQTLITTVYPAVEPKADASSDVWLSPQYSQSYRRFFGGVSGSYFNVKSEDTENERTLLTRFEAEHECNLVPECLGILRWDSFFRETWFSLFTEDNVVRINNREQTLYSLVDVPSYTFIQKMSLVYKGKSTDDSDCVVVRAGETRYPRVNIEEEYNAPIASVDLTLATDEETGSIVVGNGLWTKCWTRRPDITSKVDCYEAAKTSGVYGFAFSEDSSTCLVYTGITDSLKIKLDKYNSETRLSLYDPCNENAEWFT